MQELNRRAFLMAIVVATSFLAAPAFSEDGDSGGDSDSGGGSDSDSGGDSDNSGSGSDNSGSGNDDNDDNDNDDNDNDDNEQDNDDDNNSGSGKDDHNRALRVVKDGKAVPLRKLKSFLAQNYPGKILNVSLQRKSGIYYYRVRILSSGNRIKTLSLNALTLKSGAV